jgi:F-type H+-transporting ATPase subunit epsilon
MPTLALSIVTPQRLVLETDAQWVDIPAESGAMRALPLHAPTLGALGAGEVRFADSSTGAEKTITIDGGFFEVLPDRVTLLADTAS